MYSSDSYISFDRPDRVYGPGEWVSGRVFLKLHTPQRVTGILAEFNGNCQIDLPSRSVLKRFQRDSVDRQEDLKEEYLNYAYFILGSQHGCEMYLQAGSQCFPFTCQLPKDIPPTFNCKNGFIKYKVTISFMRMIDFDKQIQASFRVASKVNLNDFPEFNKPATIHMERSFYNLCCDIVPVILDVHVNNGAYCSGDSLFYTILCQNKSRISISEVKISIIRIVSFKSRNKYTHSLDTIWVKALGKVPKGRCKEWKDEIRIPKDITPSYLKYCTLMDLDYILKVSCYSKLLRTKLSIEKPIIIGTEPFGSVYPMNINKRTNVSKRTPSLGGQELETFVFDFMSK